VTGPKVTPTPLAPTPTATPTPTTGVNIAGRWIGTESACNFPDVSASATFTQSGTQIQGTLNADGYCGFIDLQVSGTVGGSSISATGPKGVTVTGTVDGNRMSLHVVGIEIDGPYADMLLEPQ
jgi:hypothetical protein